MGEGNFDTDKKKHGFRITVAEEEEVQWGFWRCVRFDGASQRARPREGDQTEFKASVSITRSHSCRRSKFFFNNFFFAFYYCSVLLRGKIIGKLLRREI